MSNIFTIKTFKYSIFRNALKDLKKYSGRPKAALKTVELLRCIAESLVWSDQHDHNFFE